MVLSYDQQTQKDNDKKSNDYFNVSVILTKCPQNLSPGRFRHAEVESAVQNLENLHLEAKI